MKRVLSAVMLIMLIMSGCAAQSETTKESEPSSATVTTDVSEKTEESSSETESKTEAENNMNKESKVKITVDGKTFTATLENNDSVKELVERMPFTVNMQELNGNEKYYQFSDSFPSNPQAVGSIKAGDLMLYQSDYLVVFYEGHETSYRYTRLGVIDDADGLANALGSGSAEVTFELVK